LSRHAEILEAAQGLFGRHGLKKVTTDDIAREAHVSKSTIYKRYGNKHEILQAVVRREMGELMHRITAAVEDEGTVEGKLRAHLLTKIGTVHQLINLHKVTSDSMHEHWEHAQDLREEFRLAESRLIRDILAWGVAEEDLDIPDIDVTARVMAVSLESLEYPWAIADLDLTVTEQVDVMLGIVLNGLRGRG